MDFKPLYKSGDLRILGSKNIYAKWNRIMFLISRKESPKLLMNFRVAKHSVLFVFTLDKRHKYEVYHYFYMPKFRGRGKPLLARH